MVYSGVRGIEGNWTKSFFRLQNGVATYKGYIVIE